ncbi:hypothetical protein [Burkholderia gladioli]|uniref:hypothetical protein n=1 Tax=Burkholderia gladioli TaxID=28095 RepID=UPI000FD9B384|nr:hypothetical protein [Burkholderia gladioli]
MEDSKLVGRAETIHGLGILATLACVVFVIAGALLVLLMPEQLISQECVVMGCLALAALSVALRIYEKNLRRSIR